MDYEERDFTITIINWSKVMDQTALKEFICKTCEESNIPLHHNYPNPDALAVLVLEQLKEAIEAQFPKTAHAFHFFITKMIS